jgi:hypothetical protein
MAKVAKRATGNESPVGRQNRILRRNRNAAIRALEVLGCCDTHRLTAKGRQEFREALASNLRLLLWSSPAVIESRRSSPTVNCGRYQV